MRAQNFRWAPIAATLLLGIIASSGQAQPPRSGGFDLTYGFGNGNGGEFKDRSGVLSSFELFFSTRMDGGNTPLLLGAQAIYFAADDADYDCIPSQIYLGCVRKFPDVGGGGLLVAFEPNVLTNTFVHVNTGFAVVQPTTDGGPTIGFLGAARLGQSIGRHLAILAGVRILAIPDMRGESVSLTGWQVGLRLR